MELRRGDVVVTAAPGDFGKPRPALVVQPDLLNETHASVVVCLLTSELVDAPLLRIPVEPDGANGLRAPSQVMADKPVALRRERISQCIGRVDDAVMLAVGRSLAFVLGLG